MLDPVSMALTRGGIVPENKEQLYLHTVLHKKSTPVLSGGEIWENITSLQRGIIVLSKILAYTFLACAFCLRVLRPTLN